MKLRGLVALLCLLLPAVPGSASALTSVPTELATGACCHVDGTCTVTAAADCRCPDSWLGPGSVCNGGIPCPQAPGACCLNGTGVCQMLWHPLCTLADGNYLGDLTTCDPVPCSGPLGACCYSGQCGLTTELQCAYIPGSSYQGVGTNCTPWCAPGPSQKGACCKQDQTCVVTWQDFCIGCSFFAGVGTTCSPNPCSTLTGACCAVDGTCTQTTLSGCASDHIWAGYNLSCAPNPCTGANLGACCVQTICAIVTAAACTSNSGIFLGNGTTCDSNPCGGGTGACCLTNGICMLLTTSACAEGAGSYRGDGTTCAPDNPCNTPVKTQSWGQIKAQYR